MTQGPNLVAHAVRDRLREVRYAFRREVETPGLFLRESFRTFDPSRLIAVGSAFGGPALRAMDRVLTHVETLASDVVRPRPDQVRLPAFDAYFGSSTLYSETLYDVCKDLLVHGGVRNALLSEQAFDAAQHRFLATWSGPTTDVAAAAAHLTLAIATARPIRRAQMGRTPRLPDLRRQLNVYCAAAIGLETALVTRDPRLADEADLLRGSVASTALARLDRFAQAIDGPEPVADLARHFETMLPYLP